MASAEIIVTNRLGLHARAAAKLVRIAARYESVIKLHGKNNSVFADAKSILSVLTLAASCGSELTVECHGPDEIEALEQIVYLFESKFGEE
jgi:phosphotransferase system HPr (HPr) family protein